MSSSVFGSSFYVLTGFHGAHVALGIIWLITLLVSALRGNLRHRDPVLVEVAGLYWHFVDIVWIAVFTIVYLFTEASKIEVMTMRRLGASSPAVFRRPLNVERRRKSYGICSENGARREHFTMETALKHEAVDVDEVEEVDPQKKEYWVIAAVLAFVTFLEFIVVYIPQLGSLMVPALVVLSAIKFLYVVRIFMHLKYDAPIFSWAMTTGAVLALAIGISLVAVVVFGAGLEALPF